MIALASATGRNNAKKGRVIQVGYSSVEQKLSVRSCESQIPFKNPQWQGIYLETGAISTASPAVAL
jgi:hypothetical protein